ncbi:MAG: hypothetical protein CM15mV28_0720 [Thaumasvirus sp.]|nr:MAG: hypothetical protein CM15mV28_0720 [Thaumasvirus sp.]
MRRYDDQLWYCTSQMKNKKTEAVLSQWFDNPWASKYIQNILFDKPFGKGFIIGANYEKRNVRSSQGTFCW